MLASITPFVSLSAFVLLLLVSLSVPIIKSLFLFRLTADATNLYGVADANGSATFGVWGYCVSAIDISIAAISQTSTSPECTDPKLGYTFDSTIAAALNVEQYANLINKHSAAALVLHPIACGLAFLTFLSSLFILCRGTGRMPSLCTLGIGLVAAILTTIAFLIDVIVVAIIRHRVSDETDGQLQLTWGNAVWMVLGATVALWLRVVGACCGMCACGRHRNKGGRY
ncbi:pali-domain-containing protein [Armillaria luteobubalina]|uniref:Pali-domain-containing protein n=1 Tax=Armillaria luteobubalina TaxID=153913 RepID=A0AA39QIW8_9AGAR|nr:pali-domain-containing protein [Armillaria luteobubalina]